MKLILPNSTLYEDEILQLIDEAKIQHFKGIFMRDEIGLSTPNKIEYGIINLSSHEQKGTHWCTWIKKNKERYYFDSFGMGPPIELIKYLKTSYEFSNRIPCIKSNAITVQHFSEQNCGALCIFMIFNLFKGRAFSEIIEELRLRYHSSHPSPLILQ